MSATTHRTPPQRLNGVVLNKQQGQLHMLPSMYWHAEPTNGGTLRMFLNYARHTEIDGQHCSCCISFQVKSLTLGTKGLSGTSFVRTYAFLKTKAVPLHAMEALGGEEAHLLFIHDLGTRWGWVVSVTPRPRFSPGERTPGTHWTGGWVGPRAGLGTEARGKILNTKLHEYPFKQELFRLLQGRSDEETGTSRRWKQGYKSSSRTLDNPQHSMRLITESRSSTFDYLCQKLVKGYLRALT
jgi:hypothetical protein